MPATPRNLLYCPADFRLSLFGAVVALLLTSCGGASGGIADPSAGYDQSEVLEAMRVRRSRAQVTVEATVVKVLPDDRRGIPHQRFLIRLSNGVRVLVAHNVRLGTRVPIEPGDVVRIHGEYIWNEKGGLLHWTHRTNTPTHTAGWIEHDGVLYQ